MANDEKVNILVVDDLPEKLLVYETILEGLGQNVVTARSGREALRFLLEREFAVILLDVNMPDMDGFETAAMIRSRRQTAHTPIIFVTAFSDEMHTAQGYSLGAVDYILSPVVPEILAPRSGSSSTSTRRRSRSSGRPKSTSRWRGRRRRGPRPRRRTVDRRSSPRRAPSWSIRSITRRFARAGPAGGPLPGRPLRGDPAGEPSDGDPGRAGLDRPDRRLVPPDRREADRPLDPLTAILDRVSGNGSARVPPADQRPGSGRAAEAAPGSTRDRQADRDRQPSASSRAR